MFQPDLKGLHSHEEILAMDGRGSKQKCAVLYEPFRAVCLYRTVCGTCYIVCFQVLLALRVDSSARTEVDVSALSRFAMVATTVLMDQMKLAARVRQTEVIRHDCLV